MEGEEDTEDAEEMEGEEDEESAEVETEKKVEKGKENATNEREEKHLLPLPRKGLFNLEEMEGFSGLKERLQQSVIIGIDPGV